MSGNGFLFAIFVDSYVGEGRFSNFEASGASVFLAADRLHPYLQFFHEPDNHAGNPCSHMGFVKCCQMTWDFFLTFLPVPHKLFMYNAILCQGWSA